MKTPVTVISVIVLVNACIWGFAIAMCSRALSGIDGYPLIQNILSGCAGMSLIVVGGGLAGLAKRLRSQE